MPRSTAARSRETISCLSGGGPYEKLIPMQPSPSAETSRLLLPNLRFCIVYPHLQVRARHPGSGIPILRNYCLILLQHYGIVNGSTSAKLFLRQAPDVEHVGSSASSSGAAFRQSNLAIH